MALPWKQEYRISVAVVDEQHRRLAKLVDELYAARNTHRSASEVRETLNTLIAFTKLHFAAEEQRMRTYGYPDRKAHESAHALVLEQMSNLAASFGSKTAIAVNPRADISQDWVTKHLLERDVPLGTFLNDRGVY